MNEKQELHLRQQAIRLWLHGVASKNITRSAANHSKGVGFDSLSKEGTRRQRTPVSVWIWRISQDSAKKTQANGSGPRSDMVTLWRERDYNCETRRE